MKLPDILVGMESDNENILRIKQRINEIIEYLKSTENKK